MSSYREELNDVLENGDTGDLLDLAERWEKRLTECVNLLEVWGNSIQSEIAPIWVDLRNILVDE